MFQFAGAAFVDLPGRHSKILPQYRKIYRKSIWRVPHGTSVAEASSLWQRCCGRSHFFCIYIWIYRWNLWPLNAADERTASRDNLSGKICEPRHLHSSADLQKRRTDSHRGLCGRGCTGEDSRCGDCHKKIPETLVRDFMELFHSPIAKVSAE